LGHAGPQLHREIAQHIVNVDARLQIHHVVALGPLTAFMASEMTKHWKNDRVSVFAKLDHQASAFIAQLLKPGDAVLIKGSRGMGMERLIPSIENQFGSMVVPDTGASSRRRRSAAPVAAKNS